MFNLVLSHISKHKIQSIGMVLAVIFATGAFLSALLLFYGAKSGLEISKDRLGGDILIVPAKAETNLDDKAILFGGAPVTAYISKDIATEVSDIEGVTNVTPQFFGQTLGGSDCCTGIDPVRLIGVDFANDTVIKPWLGDGFCGDLVDNNVVIGCNVTSFDGTPPYLILGHEVNVIGTLDPTGTAVDIGIYMNIDTVRSYMAEKEDFAAYWRSNGSPSNLVSAILVQTEQGKAKGIAKGIADKYTDCSVTVTSSLFKEIEDNMDALFILMIIAVVILIIVCGFQLFAGFYTETYERKQEFGLYMALGASHSDIKGLILTEAAFLTGIGTICGVGVGFLFYKLILSLITVSGNFVFIDPGLGIFLLSSVAVIVVFGILSLLAVIAPLSKIKKINPTIALQHQDID